MTSLFENVSVDLATGCWNWTGAKITGGYGTMSVSGVTRYVHRIVAWMFLGAPKEGTNVYICHRCDNPSCVNPRHLFIGDNRANQLDRVAKGRHYLRNLTHCKRGHEFSEANTYWCVRNGNRVRSCRECKRQINRAIGERKKNEKKIHLISLPASGA